MTAWVVDTSPLIFLAKLGYLDLLRKGAGIISIFRGEDAPETGA